MSQFSDRTLSALREELSKLAAPNFHSLVGGAGAGMGLGAAVGGVGGAVHGAVKGYRKAKEEGSSGLVGGLAGAAGGAARGAGVGAAAGALGGAGLGAASPKALGRLVSADNAAGSAARFGQRQVHSLTGWTPKKGIESIRGGAYDAREALRTAKGAKEVQQAHKALETAEASQRMGLTNLPGYAKAVNREGLANVLKTDAAAQWHSGGIAAKALGVGLPAAALAAEVAKKEQPEGEGRGQALGRAIGGTIGGVMGTAMPIAGQIALGSGLAATGNFIGKGIDRLRGRRPLKTYTPPPPEQYPGSHVPTERIMSPAAAGQPPEGLIS